MISKKNRFLNWFDANIAAILLASLIISVISVALYNNTQNERNSKWIVVKSDNLGHIVNCWKISGEEPEIYNNNIKWSNVDISFNNVSRTQVQNGNWEWAAHTVGVDEKLCNYGSYPAK